MLWTQTAYKEHIQSRALGGQGVSSLPLVAAGEKGLLRTGQILGRGRSRIVGEGVSQLVEAPGTEPRTREPRRAGGALAYPTSISLPSVSPGVGPRQRRSFLKSLCLLGFSMGIRGHVFPCHDHEMRMPPLSGRKIW